MFRYLLQHADAVNNKWFNFLDTLDAGQCSEKDATIF